MTSEQLITDIIDEQNKKIRIDKFLSDTFPDITRSRIKNLIEDGCVFNHDKVIDSASYKTQIGDQYTINIPEAIEANPIAEDIELDIVYEDEDLIVINKKAGMTVHPAPGSPNKTLVNALLHHCKDSLSGIGGVKRPGIVHRIDKDTSGILVVAKNDKTHVELSEQFSVHSIDRTYYAIVWGLPNPVQATITGNIARSKFDRKKMALTQNGGKHAVTHYKVLKNFNNLASLVECKLETGRTHQIRVHMASIGNPLIGDPIYSSNKTKYISKMPNDIKKVINSFTRQALHAKSLGFTHPRTKEKIYFDSNLPYDFNELMDNLETL